MTHAADTTPRNAGFNLIRGHLYRIRSRNLPYGVYDGRAGFIGIREKFGSLYLFTEYDYDQGVPYGTVIVKEDLGPIPGDTEPVEAWWVAEDGESFPFGVPRDTRGHSPGGTRQKMEVRRNNTLFEFLSKAELEHGRGVGYGGRPGDDPVEAE